jgi:hypothetical protein
MPSDKRITATLLDATYVGRTREGYVQNQRYRLRAVRTKGGVIKVKDATEELGILIYGSEYHFNANWTSLQRLGETLW